jgi:hypothetical protein
MSSDMLIKFWKSERPRGFGQRGLILDSASIPGIFVLLSILLAVSDIKGREIQLQGGELGLNSREGKVFRHRSVWECYTPL